MWVELRQTEHFLDLNYGAPTQYSDPTFKSGDESTLRFLEVNLKGMW
jgi:hypothetical protein